MYTSSMVIVLHVLIAVLSLAHTTYVFFKPSPAHFRATYSLVALTILSGIYLIASKPGHMVEACTTGLTYLVLVSFGIGCAHIKLAHGKAQDK